MLSLRGSSSPIYVSCLASRAFPEALHCVPCMVAWPSRQRMGDPSTAFVKYLVSKSLDMIPILSPLPISILLCTDPARQAKGQNTCDVLLRMSSVIPEGATKERRTDRPLDPCRVSLPCRSPDPHSRTPQYGLHKLGMNLLH